jgi:hypothetical protein
MGLRFFRRLHIAPGIGVNFSKSGPSLTLGVRGAHVTLGPKAITKTIGLPGTGIYYTNRHGYHSGAHSGVSRYSGVPPYSGIPRSGVPYSGVPHSGVPDSGVAHQSGGAGFVLGLLVGVGLVIGVIILILIAG